MARSIIRRIIAVRVLNCRNELKPRPLHLQFGDAGAISKMNEEFPNHWNFHPRRRYGKTAREWAANPNKEAVRLQRKVAATHMHNSKMK